MRCSVIQQKLLLLEENFITTLLKDIMLSLLIIANYRNIGTDNHMYRVVQHNNQFSWTSYVNDCLADVSGVTVAQQDIYIVCSAQDQDHT